MKRIAVLALVIVAVLSPSHVCSETFKFNTGTYVWNDINNWVEGTVPNATGASAILPGPNTATGDDLSIDLDVPVTLGLLDIQKPTGVGVTGDTSITGANTLTISGGTLKIINRASAAGTGTTTIGIPVSIDTTITIEQESDDLLQFTQSISGGTGLTINRTGTGNGGRTVILGAANSYGGATTLDGGGNNNFLIVRLGHTDAIPAATTISATDSVVFELAAGNFARTIGAGAGQFQFSGGRNGWGAVGADRTVTLNGGASLNWGAATFNQLVLGTNTSTHMADFTNPLVLNTSNTRIVRTFDGAGEIDGRFSGTVSGPGALHKQESGVLSLSNDNTYTGATIVEAGMLRLDHAGALGDNNLQLGSGGLLGIGADSAPLDLNNDFARELGTATGQIQLTALGGGGNAANAGFSAHGGNRNVVLLSGGSTANLVWGAGVFLSGGADPGTNRNFILADDTADGTLNFRNPIDLNGAQRTVTTRDGSAAIDGILSGMLTGSGGLIKESDGTLVLGNNNGYTGGTTVADGTLLVNNVPVMPADSGTGFGHVTVNAGTLGGIGTINGTVTVNSTGHIAPGSGGIQSLDVAGLVLNSGSLLDFELGAPGTGDVLSITAADSLTINGGTLNLTDTGGLAVGTYSLINYSGVLTGDEENITMINGPAGFSYDLVDTGTSIDLLVSAIVTENADFNNDGGIDAADYVIWRKFNPATGTGTQPTGDANGDGDIDTDDYDIWVQNFGNTATGGGSSGAVPEPATCALVALALLLTMVRRRRWVSA
jgi:autotransporter-associated beta strand protein